MIPRVTLWGAFFSGKGCLISEKGRLLCKNEHFRTPSVFADWGKMIFL